MRVGLAAALAALSALAVATTTTTARAVTCGEAFDESQNARDDGKLLEARDLLRVCNAPSCSATQQKYCAEWLADVEARVPSVVFAAKDATGGDLAGVTVRLDGAVVATKLDGRALAVDPGPHTVLFAGADRATAEVHLIVEERQKGRLITAVLAPRTEEAHPPPAPTAHPPDGAMRMAGYVVGATGIVGLGVSALFTGLAVASKNAASCGRGPACTDDPDHHIETAKSQAAISTGAFIAGGVLAATGVTLVLVARYRRGATQGTLAATPVVSFGVSGLLLEGGF